MNQLLIKYRFQGYPYIVANRKFVSLNQLRKLAYISNEVVETKIDYSEVPF